MATAARKALDSPDAKHHVDTSVLLDSICFACGASRSTAVGPAASDGDSKMTALKGMTLGTMPARGDRDPVVNRRMTMIKKLEHQRAKALDDDYVRAASCVPIARVCCFAIWTPRWNGRSCANSTITGCLRPCARIALGWS
jgi:hypothetical protein